MNRSRVKAVAGKPLKPVTIKDIARELGLSYQAVSVALSGSRRGTTNVSEATARRVKEAAKRLGYRMNVGAQDLRRQQIKQIGVAVEKLVGRHLWNSSLQTIFALDNSLRARGWRLDIHEESFEEIAAQKEISPGLISANHAGFVVYSNDLEQDAIVIKELEHYHIPWVVLDGKPGLVNTISLDHYGAGQTATRYLLDLGHERIVYIGYCTSHYSNALRAQAYQDCMGERGFEPRRTDWVLDWTSQVQPRTGKHLGFDDPVIASDLIEQVRAEDITAVLAFDDSIAWKTNQILQSAGYRVPKDISIMGMNNIVHTDFCAPPLTTVTLHYFDLGTIAADCIIKRIESPEESFKRKPISTSLVVRGSTTKPRTA